VEGHGSPGLEVGSYTANVTGRYVGRYQDYDTTTDIGNFWIYDANFRYTFGDIGIPGKSWLKGAYLDIGGVNLFNKLPQYSNYFFGLIGYDPAEGIFVVASCMCDWAPKCDSDTWAVRLLHVAPKPGCVGERFPRPAQPALSKTDHLTLAMLRTAGKKTAMVLVAAREGGTAEVERLLRRALCDVEATAPEIGYIRCVAPVEQLAAITRLPGIESIALSTTQLSSVYGLSALPTTVPKSAPAAATGGATPSRYMAADNPFTATRAMQALQFKEANPFFDGRGVVVGVLAAQVDLLTSELKWATDIRGKSVPRYWIGRLPVVGAFPRHRYRTGCSLPFRTLPRRRESKAPFQSSRRRRRRKYARACSYFAMWSIAHRLQSARQTGGLEFLNPQR